MPLAIESLQSIKNAEVVPLGVAEQFSINEKGERYIKRRVTHDCSFPGPSGVSVNNRVQQESLQPCFYGFCLLRILHMISAMQRRWPTKRILIGKTDLDTAYLRIHAHANTASTCIEIVDELDFLCLRSPFGTTPAPAEYTNISEAAIDLGNDLLQDQSWDTNDLKSPHRSLLPPEEKQQSASHMAKAYPLAVEIIATEASMDGFINDIITITVDDNHWIDCSKSSALLVIHTLFRPLQPSEPLKLDDTISLRKLAG